MLENEIQLDLLLYRPKAFILLSYLSLLSKEKGNSSFFFSIREIRPIGGRVVLTKEQVRSNLKLLAERKYILIEKSHFPSGRQITLLSEGKNE